MYMFVCVHTHAHTYTHKHMSRSLNLKCKRKASCPIVNLMGRSQAQVGVEFSKGIVFIVGRLILCLKNGSIHGSVKIK